MVRKTAYASVLLASVLTAAPALAQTYRWTSERPDGHAPAGVMSDFLILNRDLYVGVRFYQEQFRGTSLGTLPVSSDEILDFFTVAPVSLDKQTAELDLRLGLFGFVTLQASMPVTQAEMLNTTDALLFETSSQTYGDVNIRGLFNLLEMDQYRLSLTLGGTIPTGKLKKHDKGAAGASEILPFTMQGGSGTYDVLAGLTFLTQNEVASVGAQVNSVIRVMDNRRGYRLGNEVSFTAWGAHNLSDWVSISMRALFETWGDVSGSDPGTNGAIDPSAYSFAQGGGARPDSLWYQLFPPGRTSRRPPALVRVVLHGPPGPQRPPAHSRSEPRGLLANLFLTVGLPLRPTFGPPLRRLP